MRRKIIGILVCMLLVGTVLPVSGTVIKTNKTSSSNMSGNTLYVGGSGEGNYSKIQDAIDNASYGDTIFVYNGTYYEAIRVNVENLKIIGDGRDVTFIDANSTSKAVVILQSFVNILGFTIIGKNYCIDVIEDLNSIMIFDNNLTSNFCGVAFGGYGDQKYNVLQNNIFYSNSCGISIGGYYNGYKIEFNRIRNNTFINNFHGISIDGKNNEILNNRFLNCRNQGIKFYGEKSTIENNIFIGNKIGLELHGSGNRIIRNHFENNTIGLILDEASNTLVTQNNFINNGKHATFYEENRLHGNNWDYNYWGVSFYLFGCKIIFGKINTGIPRILQFDPNFTYYYWIPWINFDWHPAKEPYDI